MIEDDVVYFKEFCRDYINSIRWQNAKTYEATAPHEYTVKSWNPDRAAWFEKLIEGIRLYGQKEKFAGKTYIYFELDGKKYWTLGHTISYTTIINRTEISTSSQTYLSLR